MTNGVVSADVTFSFTSGQAGLFRVSLVRDNTGNWKIDALVYPPAVPLHTFCNAVQQGDYQTAYGQFSIGFQQQVSEQQFASAFTGLSTCTPHFPIQTGDHATAQIQLDYSSGQTVNVQAFLIQDSSGNWKIDSLQKV